MSYHTGAFELLGAFYSLSGLNLQFIHLFFSALFIFCIAQIIIWLFQGYSSIARFCFANLTVAVILISFGFIYITWPGLLLHLPEFKNINQIVLWMRGLPTVGQAIEVYGAPINLDTLIYFIFHAFGLAIFFSLVVILVQYRKEKYLLSSITIFVGLATLALVNEALFLAAFPTFIFGIFFIEIKEKTFRKNLKKLLLLVIVTIVIISFQGGIISASLNTPGNIEKSAVIGPNKADIKEDFVSYHLSQQSSKLLPNRSEWEPLRWFHPGIGILVLVVLVALILIKRSEVLLLVSIFFVGSLSSLVAYNIIVPKFLIANGNRFLSASFLFLTLALCLSLTQLFEKVEGSKFKKLFLVGLIGWIFIPTILPPLVILTKNRFGENKFIPKFQQSSPGIRWLQNNLDFQKRVIVLDKNSPHPSGQARALVEAGVFAPIFYGNFRAFTIEASPEYIDIVYSLSPQALKRLKVTTLLIDNNFFETLPEKRKNQLENQQYFKKVFDHYDVLGAWEAIYQVNNEYLNNGEELNGTFQQLRSIVPTAARIYVDNEESFNPSFLRRPLIFSLRDSELYFLHQSGIYLNVETDINSHSPLKSGEYDYFVMGKNTDPKKLCGCKSEIVWHGIKDEVYVWKKI